jgi:hypothetical protein
VSGRDLGRRELLKVGAAAFGAYGGVPPVLQAFRRRMAAGPWQSLFFTAPELRAMCLLADLILPRDARGPAATETGAVEYADFVLSIAADHTQQLWHDGFRWLDDECGRRFGGRRFEECADPERAAVLDAIAPAPAAVPEALRPGAEWFVWVRDVVAAGYFSSRPGVEDLGYIGGTFNPEWRGAPPEVLRELGVSYDEWDRRYGGGQ